MGDKTLKSQPHLVDNRQDLANSGQFFEALKNDRIQGYVLVGGTMPLGAIERDLP